VTSSCATLDALTGSPGHHDRAGALPDELLLGGLALGFAVAVALAPIVLPVIWHGSAG